MARLSIVAGNGPDRRLVERLASRLRDRALVARFRALRPASASAPWRSRARLRRRSTCAAVAFEDAERVAVLALVEDHRRRRDDSVRPGRRRLCSTSASVRPVGAREVAFRRRRAALGAAPALAGRVVESASPPQPASSAPRREQAGESDGDARRRASAACYSERRLDRRRAAARGRDKVAASAKREEMGWRSERHWSRGPRAGSAWRSPACSARRATALTLSARRPEKLEEAVQALRDDGFEVQTVAANMTDEDDVARRLRRPPGALRPPRRAGQQRRGRDRRADGGDPDQAPRHAARRSTCGR